MSDALLHGGKPLPGRLFPGPAGAPSVVLIHEWWGLNAHVADVAGRLQREGFTVFAVDLYGGRVARDEAEASELMGALDWKVAVPLLANAREALAARGAKVAVLGFCLGGALALAAAAADPGFAACVPFYGIPQPANADVTRITARVLGHYANVDDWCTPKRVDALAQTLATAKVTATLHRYDAGHAFFNDTRAEVYSAANAALAWQRTLDFLRTALA